jgi:hypothetical protein
MASAHHEPGSLRFSRRESERVAAALLLSLLVHLGVWGGYEAGKKTGVWRQMHPPAWLHLAAKKNPSPPPASVHPSEPEIFVDVSHADAEAPVQAKYYSDKNSRAANPDDGNANVPKLNGKQKDVPKTEDTVRPSKLQPTASPQPPAAQSKPSEKPQTPGDLYPLRPGKNTAPQPPAQPERPRTLRQALAQRDQLPGQMMQQDGGVHRHALWSSLDAKATPFGNYDRAIIEAVTQRWYDLLDSHHYAEDRDGKVILRFKLKPDGTIIEMQPLDNTVGEMLGYLCQEAIEEAAPFGKWPSDMQREIGANYREITFTFYYY